MARRSKTITIVGGGLSGLVSAILLSRADFNVTLIEKKAYPFHRVCGEYISNEVLPFLKQIGVDIPGCNPSNIDELVISSPSGRRFKTHLDLGGFGLSRYTFDNLLFQKAKSQGVHCLTGTKVSSIKYFGNHFEVALADNTIVESDFVIAAYGKRTNLDKDRRFFYQRSPYMGVKYHVKIDFPDNLIQLDNFDGGYCGTVKVENNCYNLCYLSANKHLKRYGSIPEMEKNVLFKNPVLRERFLNADFVHDKPEVINEISFERKTLVENHILYCGDAAGMITPLCGNGMAMATHSAQILSNIVIAHSDSARNVEEAYQQQWNGYFENRLKIGRLIQKLFGYQFFAEAALTGFKLMPQLPRFIIKRTHGKPF